MNYMYKAIFKINDFQMNIFYTINILVSSKRTSNSVHTSTYRTMLHDRTIIRIPDYYDSPKVADDKATPHDLSPVIDMSRDKKRDRDTNYILGIGNNHG